MENQEKPKKKIDLKLFAKIYAGAFVLMIIGIAIVKSGDEKAVSNNKVVEEQLSEKQKSDLKVITDRMARKQAREVANTNWYEGGNLHSKNLIEWKAAEYKNRLATVSCPHKHVQPIVLHSALYLSHSSVVRPVELEVCTQENYVV